MLNIIHNRLFSRFGEKFYCPVCDNNVNKFIPLPSSYKENAEKHGFIYSFDDFETLNCDAYTCPHCGASDRDRLYALHISKHLMENHTKDIFVLEIAPSQPFTELLRKNKKIALRTADLMMEGVDDRIDITDMNCYDDDLFDAFICSHVLEHVPNDSKALHELLRILKPGGWGILMTPIILTIDKIDEDPLLENTGERWRRFGQGDHVRIYSKIGFVKRAERAGFIVRQYGQMHFGTEKFRKFGISDRSVLYVVEKLK